MINHLIKFEMVFFFICKSCSFYEDEASMLLNWIFLLDIHLLFLYNKTKPKWLNFKIKSTYDENIRLGGKTCTNQKNSKLGEKS